MDKTSFFELIDKYTSGEASAAERALVEAYYRRLEAGEGLAAAEGMDAERTNAAAMGVNGTLTKEEEDRLRQVMLDRLMAEVSRSPGVLSIRALPVRARPWLRMAAAAAIVLVVGASFLLFINKTEVKAPAPAHAATVPAVADVLPGRDRAILELEGGKQVVLDSAMDQALGVQGASRVLNKNGRLVYQASKLGTGADQASGKGKGSMVYNIVHTGRGNQYQMVLSDGTRVWLNAASSLRFPAFFEGNERRVELTGEAYFEVAHNDRMPFRVKTGNELIEDLGTHFNVMAYEDEPVMKTTLLEGSVKIRSTVLRPGQEAQINEQGELRTVNGVDPDQAIAWTTGFFQFDHAELREILRQLSRWYDVDVQYQGTMPERSFGGRISRSLSLSALLNVLSAKNIHFKIEKKQLIILP